MSSKILASLTGVRFKRRTHKRVSHYISTTVLASLLCCAATVFVVRAYHGGKPEYAGLASSGSTSAVVQPTSFPSTAVGYPQKTERIEAEVITIRPTGFEPREITRPEGLFLLAVENRSGLQTVQLRLDSAAGARVRDVQMPRSKHDWSEGFDLPPGTYVLTEAYHPEWLCSITIAK